MEGQFNNTNLMEIHPSGKIMRLKVPASPVEGFNIQVVNAFNTHPEIRMEHLWYIHALPLLPMPVIRSPLLTYLSYNHKNPWVPCYGDSIAMVSCLRNIYHCYNSKELKYFEDNKQRILEARGTYEKSIEDLRESLQNNLNDLYRANLNERQSLEQFAKYLEYFTVEVIRTLERALLQIFGIIYDLTPHVYPDSSVLDNERLAAIPKLYAHIFTTKHTILNERLKKFANQTEEVRYFHPEEIEERMKTTPKEEIYKGFIDRTTLWEYYQSLDCDNILKK